MCVCRRLRAHIAEENQVFALAKDYLRREQKHLNERRAAVQTARQNKVLTTTFTSE